ncbi:16288_t:CDS:2, partial [Entrophospora sp. SA101]
DPEYDIADGEPRYNLKKSKIHIITSRKLNEGQNRIAVRIESRYNGIIDNVEAEFV